MSDPVTTTVSPTPVNDRPVAAISLGFSPPPYAEETAYYVSGFDSSDEEGSPLQCRWDWGDGTTLDVPCYGVLPQHAWNRPDTYTITLTLSSLTDFLGCAGTVGTSTTTVDFASVTLAGTQRICPGQ